VKKSNRNVLVGPKNGVKILTLKLHYVVFFVVITLFGEQHNIEKHTRTIQYVCVNCKAKNTEKRDTKTTTTTTTTTT
jgi:hypothetical protein